MKRSPGRPRVDDDDESVPVHLTLPARQYDRIYERAADRGITVPEQIRRDLDGEKKNAK